MTWFDNPSIIPASKATVAIDDNSTDGTISFISVKIPKKDLTIKLIKIYRRTNRKGLIKNVSSFN